MEMFELRYFLGVAETENLHQAALRLRVSPPSLSKAVTRLEKKLAVSLFEKRGRNIFLTREGTLLKERAIQLLALADSTQKDVQALNSNISLRVIGPESLLAFASQDYLSKWSEKGGTVHLSYHSASETDALNELRQKRSDIAVITGERPRDLRSIKIGASQFLTCIGARHTLAARANAGKVIPVEEILEYPFVLAQENAFGQGIGPSASADGWRDDKFKRKILHLSPSLFLLTQLVRDGRAIAYIPDFLVKPTGLIPLKISGCPYVCEIKIYAVFRENLDLR